MYRALIRYLSLVLLGLAAAVWIADQAYIQRQSEVPGLEARLISEALKGYCEVNSCRAGNMPWPGLEFSRMSEFSLPENETKELARGRMLRAKSSTNENFYYVKIDDLIAQIGPFDESSQVENDWHTELFYLLLGVSVFLCFWPILRDLHQLKLAATRFARDRDPQHFRFPHSSFFSPISEAMIWMGNRLARSLALQKELSSTLSHELRTPISRLKFSVNTLPATGEEPTKAEMLEDLHELDQLVSEYLTFARQESERPLLDFSQVDLVDVVARLLDRLGQYSGKRIELIAPDSLRTRADIRSITRALKNLIENGIKYAQSEVRVGLYDDSGEVVVCIEDDGRGLEGEAFEDLFLPYVREKCVSKISGYGLGLAIVRKIVDWHGGHIIASHSIALGGARFELRLPDSPWEFDSLS
ncbi:sensor histidine kinase [Microbulbifer pacificus]|uniref:histidine kinase n=1 Tax=Microbulbifer pacificus TaxID=407164 RepID=A0AAU0N4X9_9GAMM|nr:ATP-binding protein [Microbulbifer pacificus]WOX06651.1 ATP-binding protein [Microbulbifer pacificus]